MTATEAPARFTGIKLPVPEAGVGVPIFITDTRTSAAVHLSLAGTGLLVNAYAIESPRGNLGR